MISLRLVVDTNIVVSASLKPDGLQRTVLLLAITNQPGFTFHLPFSGSIGPYSHDRKSRFAKAFDINCSNSFAGTIIGSLR